MITICWIGSVKLLTILKFNHTEVFIMMFFYIIAYVFCGFVIIFSLTSIFSNKKHVADEQGCSDE
jgi:hypothetical protein